MISRMVCLANDKLWKTFYLQAANVIMEILELSHRSGLHVFVSRSVGRDAGLECGLMFLAG